MYNKFNYVSYTREKPLFFYALFNNYIAIVSFFTSVVMFMASPILADASLASSDSVEQISGASDYEYVPYYIDLWNNEATREYYFQDVERTQTKSVSDESKYDFSSLDKTAFFLFGTEGFYRNFDYDLTIDKAIESLNNSEYENYILFYKPFHELLENIELKDSDNINSEKNVHDLISQIKSEADTSGNFEEFGMNKDDFNSLIDQIADFYFDIYKETNDRYFGAEHSHPENSIPGTSSWKLNEVQKLDGSNMSQIELLLDFSFRTTRRFIVNRNIELSTYSLTGNTNWKVFHRHTKYLMFNPFVWMTDIQYGASITNGYWSLVSDQSFMSFWGYGLQLKDNNGDEVSDFKEAETIKMKRTSNFAYEVSMYFIIITLFGVGAYFLMVRKITK